MTWLSPDRVTVESHNTMNVTQIVELVEWKSAVFRDLLFAFACFVPTNICIWWKTQSDLTPCYGQWEKPRLNIKSSLINSVRPSDAYMRLQHRPSLVQIMACRLFGAKPLSEPMLAYCQLHPRNKPQWHFIKITQFSFKKMHLKILSASMC